MDVVRVIASFLEISSLLLIWSKFEKRNKLLFNFLIAVFLIIIGFMIEGVNPVTDFIISYSLMVLSLAVTYKQSVLETLLKIIVSYAIVMFIEFIILLGFALVYGDMLQISENKVLLTANIVLAIIASIIYRSNLVNSVFVKLNGYLTDINFKFKNIWIVNTLFYCMVIKVIWDYSPDLILRYKFFIFLIFMLVYVLNIYIFNNDVLKYEKNKMQEYYDKYTPVMTSIVEDVRSKQHEYKNHINAIYGIVQVTDEQDMKKELSSYLESISKNIEPIEMVRGENSIINAILYSKVCDAKNTGIRFSYEISEISKLPIEGYELSEILSNLLNNAFEAIQNDLNNAKIVILNIYENEEKMIIQVKNSGHTLKAKNIDKIFKKGFSTKNRGSGYGLYNLKQLVDDNEGKVVISFEDNYTVFEVNIPINIKKL